MHWSALGDGYSDALLRADDHDIQISSCGRSRRVATVRRPPNFQRPAESLWVAKARYVHEKRRGKLGPKLGPNDIFGWDQVRGFRRDEVENL
jgi:hypothetical protein